MLVHLDFHSKLWLSAMYCQYHVQDRSLSIRTTDAIFVMQFSNVPKLEVHMQIIKFLMALVCELEKVGTICKSCFMLLRVFGRITVEWRKLTMNI